MTLIRSDAIDSLVVGRSAGFSEPCVVNIRLIWKFADRREKYSIMSQPNNFEISKKKVKRRRCGDVKKEEQQKSLALLKTAQGRTFLRNISDYSRFRRGKARLTLLDISCDFNQ